MSLSKLCQVCIVFLCFTIPSIGSPQTAVVFSEDFETGWGLWSADNGVWEVGTPVPSPEGTPAHGPESCHQGSQCAGTALSGELPGDADSRLISPSILLPEATGDQEIHLRVWQWFSYATNDLKPYCDYGMVEVSIYDGGVWSEWMDTGTMVTLISSLWSPLSVDLTQYAGKKMRVAFRHLTDSSVLPVVTCEQSSAGGWYIDNVEITTNAVIDPCCSPPEGDPSTAPTIEILGLQPGDQLVRGHVSNVDVNTARVVLYAKTDQWYVQPLTTTPFTEIQSDGSWENSTHPWNRMVALLVDETYVPDNTRTEHPASAAGVLAWDEVPERSADRIIDFSEHSWIVKTGDLAGPGPNYFSDSPENVWVDADGLHLQIRFRDNRWYCSEVFLPASLGYGLYRFTVTSRIDTLDYHAVFAGFVYEGQDREFDVEFSRVLAEPNNAQYVVQPYTQPGNIKQFTMPSEAITSHQFEWRADRIEFLSWIGDSAVPEQEDIISSWTYTGPNIPPPGGERMRFNLWLFEGQAPVSGLEDEVVIQSFHYSP